MAIPQLFVVNVEEEPPTQNSQPEPEFFYGDYYFLSGEKDTWQQVPHKEPITMYKLFCSLYGIDASFINYRITLNGKPVSGNTVIQREDYVEMYLV